MRTLVLQCSTALFLATLGVETNAATYCAGSEAYGQQPTDDGEGIDGFQLFGVGQCNSHSAQITAQQQTNYVSASAFGQAEFGTLKVGLATSVAPDGQGISYVQGEVTAAIYDDLVVQGDADLSAVEFQFTIDGEFVGIARIRLYHESGLISRSDEYYSEGWLGSATYTFQVPLTNGTGSYRFEITGDAVSFEGFSPNALDFTNTARLTSVRGLGAQGRDAAISGISGTDGTSYLQFIGNTVPEPGTWAIFVMGFAVAGSAMRFRRSHTTLRVIQ